MNASTSVSAWRRRGVPSTASTIDGRMAKLRGGADVLRTESREQPRPLKCPRNAEPDDRGREPFRSASVEEDRAAVGAQKAADHIEESALARAVRTDDADDLASVDGNAVFA